MKKQKKIIALILAVVMIVSGITVSTTASVSATTAEPDDTVYKNGVVEYIVATTNATEIIGYELHARYNTEVASAVDIQNMIEFPGGEFDYSNKDIYGNYKASLYAADSGYFSVSLDAGQGFVKVIFEIKDTTTVGDIITLDSSEYYSAGYQTCTRDTGDIVTSFNILDYGDVPGSDATTEPATTEEPTTAEPDIPDDEERVTVGERFFGGKYNFEQTETDDPNNHIAYLKFVPEEDGIYTFERIDWISPTGEDRDAREVKMSIELLDENKNSLCEDVFAYECQAGTKYYLKLTYNKNDPNYVDMKSFTIIVNRAFDFVLNKSKSLNYYYDICSSEYVKFTPEVTGNYSFAAADVKYHIHSEYLRASAVTADGESISEKSNVLYDDTLNAYYRLEAGKTYYFSMSSKSAVAPEYLVCNILKAESIAGDSNGDNAVDILDSAAIQKYASGKADLTEAQIAAADVNGDGVADILDSAEIQKFASGKINKFAKKA